MTEGRVPTPARSESSGYPERRRGRRRGFVVADVVLAIGLTVMLGGLLAGSLVYARRAADHAADDRAAAATAEAVLADLVQGRPPPAGVRVEPAGAEPAIGGYRWVRVTATSHGRPASLVGLTRVDQ